MFSHCEGYRIEGGVTDGETNWNNNFNQNNNNNDNNKVMASIYKQQFYGKPHKTFMSLSSPNGPILVCIKKVGNSSDDFYLLVCTEKGFEEVRANKDSLQKSKTTRSFLKMRPTSLNVITSVRPELTKVPLCKVTDKSIQEELVKVCEPEFNKVIKSALLYCKESQRDDNDMLKNISSNVSQEYNDFLNFLGEKVELKDFSKFNGGLDIKNNSHGTHSIYSQINDVEVMYHVATMLPFFPSDPKQSERRKLISLDRVVIIFNDGSKPMSPNCIKSKSTQIIILIQPIKNFVGNSKTTIGISNDENRVVGEQPSPSLTTTTTTTTTTSPTINSNSPTPSNKIKYRVSISNRDEVPNYGPPLPDPPIFEKDDSFRNFLYQKMVGGAASLRNTPAFTSKNSEKASALINVISKYSTKGMEQI
ncbi:RapGAP/RanGAP domain-containing protein [Dictyostelium discoideum AX4]|uniref:RapA guanosine triphosphatase-activating protein B n=1 Tax=Dictyostelium discoideum TaxID=44689 RepID=RGAPB_DICDI|nr:RapGAP/RanGAP domain-containing protein [Dictyostelium discoideum AX4]Q54SS8.1 RecName: Full=RapA guanosine triphosphatase-activating protein B [Dictyostelium discoideum]EAL66329.1 RapGAP/RanGAP domain-containing protein [Dictyostelium discoideum AX4]|eukprot:XP_640307.1 RapGAP/RanGAP domain-containing protein [Dictyostelium discoideum AX4]